MCKNGSKSGVEWLIGRYVCKDHYHSSGRLEDFIGKDKNFCKTNNLFGRQQT